VIQVHYGKKPVGVLNLSAPVGRTYVTFTEVNGPTGVISEKAFSLTRYTHFVDKFDLLTKSASIQQIIADECGIDPKVCEIAEDYYRDGYRVSYPMIRARDLDEYEFLFDLVEFEPL
jgi:hypothetical protein